MLGCFRESRFWSALWFQRCSCTFFLARQKTQARYHNLLLAAALVSGIGFSRGGLIIGPFVVGLLGFASINFKNLARWSSAVRRPRFFQQEHYLFLPIILDGH